jgi:hypothetical protein
LVALHEDVGLEGLENARNIIRKLSERWDNRLTINNLCLAKRYLNFDLELVIVFRLSSGLNSKQLRAIIKRAPVGWAQPDVKSREISGLRSVIGGGIPCMHQAGVHHLTNVKGLVARPHWYEGLVFVQDIEAVQSPERVVPVRSFVWFQVVDEADCSGRSALYVFREVGFKFLFGLPNDEVDVLETLPVGVALPDDGAKQKIKGRPDIVDHITDDWAPGSRDSFDYSELKNYIASLRINIFDDGVRCSGVEGLDFCGQLPDMAFGPFDL